MALQYGFVKCKVVGEPELRPSRHGQETEYHVYVGLDVASSGGTEQWQAAINVGTDEADDSLKYRLVSDYQNALLGMISGAAPGFQDLTDTQALPALDFLRSEVLSETGSWQDSGVMDGSVDEQPTASVVSLLKQATANDADVYIFGHAYTDDGLGIHDIHMNQGSTGSYLNDASDANKDHNVIWQDGAVLVNDGGQWTGYFAAFAQQMVPTDDLGNPTPDSHPIQDSDPGSLVGQ
jgi:uncharacterized protein YukJ